MAQYYRITVGQKDRDPVFVWTPESEAVESCDIELHADGKRISNCGLTVYDPKNPQTQQLWPIANKLPDPAFNDIRVKVFLPKQDGEQLATRLVFDGKMTSLQPSFPGPSTLTINAHDDSVTLRKKALYRTFKNKTSVQIAQAIAEEYGMEVDISGIGSVIVKQRLIDIGMGGVGRGTLSDWDHLQRALAADGLEVRVHAGKMIIRDSASLVYTHTFKHDDGIVIDYKPVINHVGKPGDGGQKKMPIPGGTKGTQLSAQGTSKRETDAENADARTHRATPQGPASSHRGAHTESQGTNTDPSRHDRRRKDEATLTIRSQSDLGLQHKVNLSGWGAKFDGEWFIKTIKYSVTGGGPAISPISLQRAPIKSSVDSSNKILQPGGSR